MILLGLMAIAGAVLGAWVKPRLVAVPLAIALAEGLRGLVALAAPVAVGNGPTSFLGRTELSIIEDPLSDYLPLLAVSAGAALVAAVMGMLADRRRPTASTLDEATRVRRRVHNGRFERAAGMVESRDAQAKAEARQKAILGL